MNKFFSILFFDQVLFKLTIVFGVVFLDYLLILSVRDRLQRRQWRKPWYYHRIIQTLWMCMMAINIFFLQQLLGITHNTSDDLNIFWNNADLQIMVLFYFLYMLEEQLMVYTIEVIALGVAFFYYWDGFLNNYWAICSTCLALGVILIVSWQIQQHQKNWIDHTLIYVLSEIAFALSWALLLSQTMVHPIGEIFLFVFNFVLIMFIIHLVNILVRQRVVQYSRLSKDVKLDYLTGIGNRGSFDQSLYDSFPVFKEQGLPLSFAMCDIDHFKLVNDRYGHLFGDEVIRTVAQRSKQILAQLGTHGQVFRLGGEEFGILFRNQSSSYTKEVMTILCKSLYEEEFESHGEHVHITLSVGLSELRESDTTAKALYQRVDDYLYHSKREGRKAITSEEGVTHYLSS